MATTENTDKVIVLKLGGAILTDKSSTCTLASDSQLNQLYDQVADAYRSGQKMAIIHGVGSFGHPQAKKYEVTKGNSLEPDKDVREGVSRTRAAVLKLHSHVVDNLVQRGIPAVSVSPFEHVTTTSGTANTPQSAFDNIIKRTNRLLGQGYVPVLHGDVILDSEQGSSVLSGDVIMRELARTIPTVWRCVFVTDVNGVYESDPKSNPHARLIANLYTVNKVAYVSSNMPDVTGAMGEKVKQAQIMVGNAQGNIEVVICRTGSEACSIAISGAPIVSPEGMTIIRR